MASKQWHMKRNCSLTPKQLFKFYVLLICISSIVAFGFVLIDAWVIPIFTVIELTAVTAAFLIYCRHATDSEIIQIDGKNLLITKIIAGKETCYRFNTEHLRLEFPAKGSKKFYVCQSALCVDIGQFLTTEQQKILLADLRSHLI